MLGPDSWFSNTLCWQYWVLQWALCRNACFQGPGIKSETEPPHPSKQIPLRWGCRKRGVGAWACPALTLQQCLCSLWALQPGMQSQNATHSSLQHQSVWVLSQTEGLCQTTPFAPLWAALALWGWIRVPAWISLTSVHLPVGAGFCPCAAWCRIST